MFHFRNRILTLALIALLLTGCASGFLGGSGRAPLMSTGKLRNHLSNPDLTVIDVRTPASWAKAQTKIQGAVREDPSSHVAGWAAKYPKDKTYVLYCD